MPGRRARRWRGVLEESERLSEEQTGFSREPSGVETNIDGRFSRADSISCKKYLSRALRART